jgi:hypothetical protein
MALINELQVGRFNRLAQKLLSMKGHAAVNTLSPELSFAVNPFHGAENRYLESWDLFGVTVAQAAIVGQVAVFSLRNPAGSNVVAVVTRAQLVDGAAGTAAATDTLALARNATTDQNNLTAALGWDLRGRPSSSLIFSNNTGAPAATGGTLLGIASQTGAVNATLEFIPGGGINEIPLMPGTALRMAASANNIAALGGFWWRERSLEDSELR